MFQGLRHKKTNTKIPYVYVPLPGTALGTTYHSSKGQLGKEAPFGVTKIGHFMHRIGYRSVRRLKE